MDTGRMPGSDHLDCGHCDMASERAELDKAVFAFIQANPSAPVAERWFFIHQRAKALARIKGIAKAGNVVFCYDRMVWVLKDINGKELMCGVGDQISKPQAIEVKIDTTGMLADIARAQKILALAAGQSEEALLERVRKAVFEAMHGPDTDPMPIHSGSVVDVIARAAIEAFLPPAPAEGG
jgi:hypothetical protein